MRSVSARRPSLRRFTDWLCEQGYAVKFKRVHCLMRTLGIEAIHPQATVEPSGVWTSNAESRVDCNKRRCYR